MVQKTDWDDELTSQEIKDIEESIKDIKAGRVYTNKQLKKELGL